MSRYLSFAALAALAAGANPALAKDAPIEAPQIFRDLVSCRAIADPAQRLACYDAKVGTLAEAQEKKEVVIASREEVREAKRGLFGFTVPKIKLFGDDAEEKDEVSEITGLVTRAGRDGYGKLMFELENAGRWRQIDNEQLRDVRKGDTVTIKKAAMGSFLAKVGKGSTFRVRRVNE